MIIIAALALILILAVFGVVAFLSEHNRRPDGSETKPADPAKPKQ